MNVKKTLATVVVGATLVVGGGAIATPAIAGAATNTPAATSGTTHARHGHKGLRLRVRHEAVTISAQTIGIPRSELVSQLRAGSSIADVATAHGVAPQKVETALVDAGDKAIEQAVANHRITSERGAALTAKLPARVTKAVDAHRTHA